jgi:sulfur-oxidizing protein SoxZ
MAKSIRIRAKAKGDDTTVKALITHPMETGLRKNKKTGEKIPAHFIQEVSCKHNGNTAVTALWGPAVSKNPYLSFRIGGAKAGDTIELSWVDNQGKKDSATTTVK